MKHLIIILLIALSGGYSHAQGDTVSMHYDSAIVQYNKAVDIILNLDADASEEELIESNLQAQELFKEAFEHASAFQKVNPDNELMKEVEKGCRFALSMPIEEGEEDPGSFGYRKVKPQ